jgi:hypothetical protein
MAAYGTKKAGGDFGVQLTFPAIFQRHFEKGFAYYPSGNNAPADIMIGTDFQSEYHEQKRQFANKNVLDGIQAKKSAERLLLTGTANYHLPKAVLGQRRFANPSFGQLGNTSARRDGAVDAPFKLVATAEGGIVGRGMVGGMVGGVLNTPEGAAFYKNRLRSRVGELDKIDAVAVGYTVSQGNSIPTSDNTKEGAPSKIDFFIYLRSLSDSILENDLSKFTFENLKGLLKLLFQLGPTADLEDLNDAAKIINSMASDLRDGLESLGEGVVGEDQEYILTLQLFIEGMRRYTDIMIRSINLSAKDRQTVSKSAVKTLGFDRLMPKGTPQAVVELARTGNTRLNQAAEDVDDDDYPDDFDDDDGHFGTLAPTREDEEAGGRPRAPLAGRNGDPNRDAFGGEGRAVADIPEFFDDAAAQTDVAPLDMAGAEPNDEIPEADTASLVEDLVAAIDDAKYAVIEDLTPDDADKPLEQLLREKDVDTREFIRVVEQTLTASGHSKADIATAMRMYGVEMFKSYVAEHGAQGRVPPQPRNERQPGLPPPTVRWDEAPRPAAPQPAAPQPAVSAARAAIDAATTKDQLKAIWNSIPAAKKRGIAQPHGNTSVSNWKARLYPIVD